MKYSRLFLLPVFLFLLSAHASALVLVDTGAYECAGGVGTSCGGATLFNQSWGQQSLAAEFSLTQDTTLTSLSVWMNTFFEFGHDFTMAIYADSGDVPDAGTELFSQSVIVSDTGYGDGYDNQWQGLSGLNWLLGAGQYWLALEVREGQSYYGYVPAWQYGAPNPVENYAFYYTDNGAWLNDAVNFGLRIEGEQVSVPEPASLALFSPGLLLLYSMRRRRQKLINN